MLEPQISALLQLLSPAPMARGPQPQSYAGPPTAASFSTCTKDKDTAQQPHAQSNTCHILTSAHNRFSCPTSCSRKPLQ